MSRALTRVKLSILLASLCALSCLAQTKKSPAKPLTYKRVVWAGWGTYRDGKWCTDFVAFLTSGGFFEGLERRDTPDGAAFYKNEKRVLEFPENLVVEVQALMRDCSGSLREPSSISAAKSLMSTLKFDLRWNGDLRERAANYSMTVSPPESIIWPENDPPYWTFDFDVKSQSVPLTDSLIIEIRSANRLLTTLPIDLTAAERLPRLVR